MSISLVINWKDGSSDDVPLAGQRTAEEVWRPMAAERGLDLIAMFPSFLPIFPENLDPLLKQLDVFRAAAADMEPPYRKAIDAVDRMRPFLERLRQSDGWTASVG